MLDLSAELNAVNYTFFLAECHLETNSLLYKNLDSAETLHNSLARLDLEHTYTPNATEATPTPFTSKKLVVHLTGQTFLTEFLPWLDEIGPQNAARIEHLTLSLDLDRETRGHRATATWLSTEDKECRFRFRGPEIYEPWSNAPRELRQRGIRASAVSVKVQYYSLDDFVDTEDDFYSDGQLEARDVYADDWMVMMFEAGFAPVEDSRRGVRLYEWVHSGA